MRKFIFIGILIVSALSSNRALGQVTDLGVYENIIADTVKIKNSIFLPEKELSFTYYSSGIVVSDSLHVGHGGGLTMSSGDSTLMDGLGIGLGNSGVYTMMTLKRTGMGTYLGVGVTSPAQNLHVSGNGLISKQFAIGATQTDFYGLGDLRLQLGNLWTFFDMPSAKIMGYNSLFMEQGIPGRCVNGSASAIKMNIDGSIQLCTAPSGTISQDLEFSYLTMLSNGRVGIGTTNPKEQMQIGDIWTFHDGGTKFIGRNVTWTASGDERIVNGNASMIRFGDGTITLATAGSGAAGTEVDITGKNITLTADGNVGIGTTDITKKFHVQGDSYFSGAVGIGTTKMDEYKLRVDGKINCKEVVVTTDVPKGDVGEWPDYVFAEDYNLRSLDEVASYIEQNQRLPEIPSASDIAEKGVSLLEINTLLLKKVEELTLYIIDLQNQVNELKKR